METAGPSTMERDVKLNEFDAKLERFVDNARTLHQNIVDDVPALKRGQVWCRKCGASLKVDSAECLRSGWPKCCGYTMTIDAPT